MVLTSEKVDLWQSLETVVFSFFFSPKGEWEYNLK